MVETVLLVAVKIGPFPELKKFPRDDCGLTNKFKRTVFFQRIPCLGEKVFANFDLSNATDFEILRVTHNAENGNAELLLAIIGPGNMSDYAANRISFLNFEKGKVLDREGVLMQIKENGWIEV